MKICEALKLARSELEKIRTSQLDAEVLLSFVLKKDKSYIFAHPEKELSQTQEKKFKALIKKRKLSWPIAYLIGTKEFYNLEFFVNQNVLIPRPASEKLVDQTLKEIKRLYAICDKPLAILDIGTGCGCIAIAIAKNIKIPIEITASDICKRALSIAEKNAKYHRVKIKFIQSDLLKNVREKPDIIVANLPYITPKIYKTLSFEITKFEPRKALLAKERNYFYEKLQKELQARNWNPILIFE